MVCWIFAVMTSCTKHLSHYSHKIMPGGCIRRVEPNTGMNHHIIYSVAITGLNVVTWATHLRIPTLLREKMIEVWMNYRESWMMNATGLSVIQLYWKHEKKGLSDEDVVDNDLLFALLVVVLIWYYSLIRKSAKVLLPLMGLTVLKYLILDMHTRLGLRLVE